MISWNETASLIEKLPETVKQRVIDITECKLKIGKYALRLTLDRVLTETEQDQLVKIGCLGVGNICYNRYAPEIRHSYFYIF